MDGANASKEPGTAGPLALLRAYERVLDGAPGTASAEDLARLAVEAAALLPGVAAGLHLAAFLRDPASQSLLLAACAPGEAPPACREIDACVCGRAATGAGPRVVEGEEAAAAACTPGSPGTHLALPLACRGESFGVLHAAYAPGAAPPPPERAALERIAALVGAELQRLRGERDRASLETRFLQAQKMEAVGRLAGGVAHDFNNILTAITSYAELGLLKLAPDAPLRRNFDEILAASERAANLTQQLLAFSRRQVLSPRVVDLNAIVGDLGKMLRRLLGADVELTVTTAPAVPPVSVDPAQVEQVLINLALNSRDAMPRGGRLIIETGETVLDEGYSRSHPEVSPGRYACLAVSDSGEGMTEEVRSRIFEPFFSTRDEPRGSGLGLAAVYGIVRQSGGHVWVYSEPGIGTTFKMYFPAVEPGGAAAAPKGGSLPRGSETLLIVEDDPAVRTVTGEVLRALGYRVLEARDGTEALSVAASAPPLDLLLTDVVMPRLNGRDLHRLLAEKRPGLRVLFVSGYTGDAIVRHGMLEPGTEFLQKPFSPSAIALRVRAILDAPAR